MKKCDKMTSVLFVCVENACRSQMAEGFARQYAGKDIQVSSGGSKPSDKVNEKAVKVMDEKGIDISSHRPEEIKPEEVKKPDLVVTMGCGSDACPAPVNGKNIEWKIEDPSGKPIEKFRDVRDEIEEKVRDLLESLQ